jgi:hypothetical protein
MKNVHTGKSGSLETCLANVKEHALSLAGASVDSSERHEPKPTPENRAAGDGCCVSSCCALLDFEKVESCDQFWVVLEVVVNPIGQDMRGQDPLCAHAKSRSNKVDGLGEPPPRDEKDDNGVHRFLSHRFSFSLQVSAQQIALWWGQTLEDFELCVLSVPVSYVIPHEKHEIAQKHGSGQNENNLHGSTKVRITFVRRVPHDHKLWEKPEKAGRKEEAKPYLRRLLDKFTEFREPVHFGISFLHNVKEHPTEEAKINL